MRRVTLPGVLRRRRSEAVGRGCLLACCDKDVPLLP